MQNIEWIESLLVERAPSLALLQETLTAALNDKADAQRAIATVRLLASELLATAQAVDECLTGAPCPLFDEAFIRADVFV